MSESDPPPQAARELVDPTTLADPRATRVFRLLDRIVTNNIQKYEHAQDFNFPFLLTEQELRELAKEAIRALEANSSQSPIEFDGTSRFEDRSKLRFDNFEVFLDRAGKRKDPESIIVNWSTFEIDEAGSPNSGKISIAFITEKRLVSQSLDPEELPTAFVKLEVSGSEQRWVDQTFDDLVPHITSVKLAGILRPLWIFRNAWLVQILSLCLGWGAMLTSLSTVGLLFSGGERKERADVLSSIKAAPTAEMKLDLYYQWAFTPSSPPWYKDAAVFGFSMLLFALVYFLAKVSLPKLTPNSAIAIGLANRRAMSALDTFKFIVFTVIICGLVAPVVIELIKWLLS